MYKKIVTVILQDVNVLRVANLSGTSPNYWYRFSEGAAQISGILAADGLTGSPRRTIRAHKEELTVWLCSPNSSFDAWHGLLLMTDHVEKL